MTMSKIFGYCKGKIFVVFWETFQTELNGTENGSVCNIIVIEGYHGRQF